VTNPSLYNQNDWSKLDGRRWYYLLSHHPDLVDVCDEVDGWSKLDGEDWIWLIRAQPQFVDKCNWWKLNEDDWSTLYDTQPFLRNFIKRYKNHYLMMKEM
jgi:hypothetical protein